MAKTDTRVRCMEDLDTVVDCDAHISESEEDIYPYLEDPFDELLNPNEGHAEHSKALYPNAGYLTPEKTGKIESHALETPEDIRDAMALFQIDKIVLTPGMNLRLAYVHHDELAAGLATAYNSWLLDKILDADDDFYGAILVAPQRPDLAVEEIERRKDESGLLAVTIPGAGADPPLGHRRYDPIYEAAERAGLPILIHCGSTGLMANFPTQWRGTKRYLDAHLLGHPLDHMVHLSTMMTNGVPVRYPDLEFVLQEGGIGWVPFFMERYDNEYMEKQYDAPSLEKTPSEYIRDQFYFTSQPVEGADNPKYITNMIRLMDGADNLLFSTDYPHFDFDNSDTLLKSLRGEFDATELNDIYGGNAVDLFNL